MWLSGPGAVVRTYGPDTTSVAPARRFVAEQVDAAGLDGSLAALLVSELASNAVEHARTEFRVTVLAVGRGVRVAVHDGAPLTVPDGQFLAGSVELPDPLALRGRGLSIVCRAAVGCGVIDEGPRGKTIWFELGSGAGGSGRATP